MIKVGPHTPAAPWPGEQLRDEPSLEAATPGDLTALRWGWGGEPSLSPEGAAFGRCTAVKGQMAQKAGGFSRHRKKCPQLRSILRSGFQAALQQPGLRLDPPSAVCQPRGRLVLPPPPGCSSANSSRSDRRAAHFPPPSSPTASLPGRTVGNIYAPKTPWVRAFATTSVGYIPPPPHNSCLCRALILSSSRKIRLRQHPSLSPNR